MAVTPVRRSSVGSVIVAIVLMAGIAAGHYYYTKQAKENPQASSSLTSPSAPQSSPGPAEPAAPEPSGLTVDELTAADLPASITLQKDEQLRFKKGNTFVAKSGTPLFFVDKYVRDAKPGEKFPILDYDPEKRKVFLGARDDSGSLVAFNTLDLHDSSTIGDTVPANTVVTLQGISNGDALVAHQGERFAVPVGDTDLLQQATQRRAQK